MFESVSNPEYSSFIALSRYARWLPEKKRRETWEETVNRYIDFMGVQGQLKGKDLATLADCRNAIVDLEVMPSMRSLMTAGRALGRDNVAGYNCAYITMSRQRAFDEMMYILLCGTGVGYSVERQYVQQLPFIAEEMYDSDTTIMVADSKIGWASSFRELVSLLYGGKIPKWNLSKVRAAGEPLKTFGGRASGPGPLEDLFNFAVELFRGAAGRRFTSIEVHDLCCKIAEIVVVGGVRRAACISLSNLSDDRMRHAKSGQWWVENQQRRLANNSVCYTEKPDAESFLREWVSLVESKSGERGIFNREASKKQAEKNGRRDAEQDFGCNPCSEIILRDRQFCNLSEVIVRAGDTFEDLKRKVRLATILGTLQATLTDFRYLSKKWRQNTEEEALLGVSLTGIMDHPFLSGGSTHNLDIMQTFDTEELGWRSDDDGIFYDLPLEKVLETLKEVAIETNKVWAEKLGINPASATTCVKPSGTVSQLVDSSSGIHPRYSRYYVRTVRADKKDPLAQMMVEQGFPVEDDITKPDSTYVFSFPMKAPKDSVFRDDRTAIEQLEHWLIYQRHWCEHKPSVTIYVRDEEWLEVGAWVQKYFDEVSGVSFLPHSNHNYKQAPYQEISEGEYLGRVESMPKDVDWRLLGNYEDRDNTEGAQTMACTGGSCEL
jgi:ribonucleoside-diphosphate reductase alpha chain